MTSLVWITSIVSIVLTFVVSYFMIPTLGDGTLWWKLSSIISCGTLAGAVIPELVKVFTSTNSSHVQGSRDIGDRKAEPHWEFCRDSWPAIFQPTGWD